MSQLLFPTPDTAQYPVAHVQEANDGTDLGEAEPITKEDKIIRTIISGAIGLLIGVVEAIIVSNSLVEIANSKAFSIVRMLKGWKATFRSPSFVQLFIHRNTNSSAFPCLPLCLIHCVLTTTNPFLLIVPLLWLRSLVFPFFCSPPSSLGESGFLTKAAPSPSMPSSLSPSSSPFALFYASSWTPVMSQAWPRPRKFVQPLSVLFLLSKRSKCSKYPA